MNKKSRKLAEIVGFISFGVLLLFLVFNGLNKGFQKQCEIDGIPSSQCSLFDRIVNDMLSANLWWVLICLTCFTLSNMSRSIRWGMLLKPLGHQPRFWNLFLTIMLGYFANLGFPRAGELIKSGSLSKYEGINFEKVLGTVVTSRILDMICLGIVGALALTLQFDTIYKFIFVNVLEKFSLNSLSVMAISILTLGGIAVLAIYKMKNSRSPLILKIKALFVNFKNGVISIKEVENIPLLIMHSGFIWVMYVMMTYLGFYAFEPTSGIGLSAGIVVFFIGALGFVVPSSGGIGTYHFLIIFGLGIYQIDQIDAFSYANILFFSIHIFGNVIFGLAAVILLPKLNQKTIIKIDKSPIQKTDLIKGEI